MRLGNESNPFVVDARVAHVPVHDDIEDNQEFNDMSVFIQEAFQAIIL